MLLRLLLSTFPHCLACLFVFFSSLSVLISRHLCRPDPRDKNTDIFNARCTLLWQFCLVHYFLRCFFLFIFIATFIIYLFMFNRLCINFVCEINNSLIFTSFVYCIRLSLSLFLVFLIFLSFFVDIFTICDHGFLYPHSHRSSIFYMSRVSCISSSYLHQFQNCYFWSPSSDPLRLLVIAERRVLDASSGFAWATPSDETLAASKSSCIWFVLGKTQIESPHLLISDWNTFPSY
jgi:hypothetical protein